MAAGYPVIVLALFAIHLLLPQRGGLLALTQVLAPHFALVAVVLVPLALPARARVLRLALVALAAVSLLRFGPGLVSLPRDVLEAERAVHVLSWNVEHGGARGDVVVGAILAAEVDLVAIQELSPPILAALESDPRIASRFPHRSTIPHPSVRGMGIWSRYPLTVRHQAFESPLQEVVVATPAGPLTLLNAHPLMIRFRGGAAGWFDPVHRDAALEDLRERIDAALAAGERLLVAGDLNVTDREPAWREVSAGLEDLHRVVGLGTGSTWRPSDWRNLPFGLIRIDYLLAGPGVRPVAVHADCRPRGSDHCILQGIVELEAWR
jgi:vancomycin resistance protein VanJ